EPVLDLPGHPVAVTHAFVTSVPTTAARKHASEPLAHEPPHCHARSHSVCCRASSSYIPTPPPPASCLPRHRRAGPRPTIAPPHRAATRAEHAVPQVSSPAHVAARAWRSAGRTRAHRQRG